ncbi:hypothetical protein N0V95_000344 [Ascochyta clinopodiicola]|nr:hypothetical protein N0V95_000344 [Ascochyta clinopodiicola]
MRKSKVTPPPKPSSAAAAALPTYDRTFWKRYSNSPIYLKIGTIIRRLGLKQINLGPHPGRPVFDYENVTQLAKAVTEVSTQLPRALEDLLDAATATGNTSLHKHIEELLRRFGNTIWGANQERTWLLQASDGEAEYSKDLVFESGTDRDILAHHLRLWILSKAFNTVRNKGRAGILVSDTNTDSQRNRHSIGQLGESSLADLHTRDYSQIPQAQNRSLLPATYIYKSKRIKSEKILQRETLPDEWCADDTTVWTDEGDERPEPLRKDVLSATSHISVQAQEYSKDNLQQKEPNSKRKRRAAKKYLSEEIIRNSSDEPEQDNILTHIATDEAVEWIVGTKKHTPAPGSREQPHDGEHIISATGLDAELVSSLPKPSIPVAISSAMPLAKRPLPLNEYWDKSTWRFYHLRGNERQALFQTLRSLGLKVIPLHRVHFSIDKTTFATLDNDIDTIAETLSSQFSANQLVQSAADSNYLNEQIDALLQKHSSMWSLDADRSQLLVPGVEEEYPKDLFYEESEGQKLIWIHLHRWIFLMAFRNCRQMRGQKVSDMDKVPQPKDTEVPKEMLREYQLGGTYIVGAPDESSSSPSGSAGSASTVEHGTVAERTLKDCERDLLEVMGAFFENEKTKGDQNTVGESLLAVGPAPAAGGVSRRQRLRVNSFRDTAQENHSQAPKRQKIIHHTTVDASDGSELCTLFMSYLELYNDPKYGELAALKNLAAKLSILERYSTRFHTRKGVAFATAFFIVAFPTWLMYRNDIARTKRRLAAMHSSEQTSHHHVAVMERSRLATELRQAHERFVGAGHDGLRPEQVIYRAFITLQNEHANSMKAEDIRRGFKGMEDELKSLGDELMDEGGKWILGDFASVSNLKGLQLHTRVGVGLYHRY